MGIGDNHKQFLNAVNLFSKSNRYCGMMPRWVVDSCSSNAVREAFQMGCVAYSYVDSDDFPGLEGMILTDKGIKALES